MPLCKKYELEAGVSVGIWHITESMEELLAGVNLSGEEVQLFNTYTNLQRKKQWLGYRNIFKHLLPPGIPAHLSYDEHGKPSLNAAPGYISVSHAGDYAAAVYSYKLPVGIDIEQLKNRIERVKERFLSASELSATTTECRLEKLYIHWGAKEALYKLYGRPEVDFKNDIIVHPFDYLCDMNGTCEATMTTPEYTRTFRVHYTKLQDYMVTVAF